MLKFEEDRLSWDYNIPRSVIFEFVNYNNCPICQHEEIREWTAPYIVALVPFDRVCYLLKKYFDYVTTP